MFRFIIGLLSVSFLLLTAACSHGPRQMSASSASDSTSAAEDVRNADQFYAQRADLNQLRRGIVSLRQATTTDPGNYEAAWKLSKFDYYLATHTDDDKERDEALRDGITAGKAAVQLQHEKPDGHFWLGANYGGSAEHSTLAGLATVADIRSEMETVLRLDEGYQDGSAHMVLGLVYLNAPQLVGGDPQKAVSEMEKGLRFGEPNAFLHLHLAEAYRKVGRNDDARRELKKILSMTPDPNYLPEYKEASADAQKLLEEIDQQKT